MDFNPHYDFAKGGKTKKFPVAVKRRIDEINEMLPKVDRPALASFCGLIQVVPPEYSRLALCEEKI